MHSLIHSFTTSAVCQAQCGVRRAGSGSVSRAGTGHRDWDPPLPVGASLCSAGVDHAAAVAEGEPAGLPGLGEHCWRRHGGQGLRAGHLPPPSHTPLPKCCCVPPDPPSRCSLPPPRSLPDPPVPPGLLLEGAALGRWVSPPPWGPSALGAVAVAGVLGVTEVTGIAGVPGVTVALRSGGSVGF